MTSATLLVVGFVVDDDVDVALDGVRSGAVLRLLLIRLLPGETMLGLFDERVAVRVTGALGSLRSAGGGGTRAASRNI
jgi:hypothetical protein